MPRIAHISDLHFSHITLNPLQFFSKRWVGNGNLIFSRKRSFSETLLHPLPHLFQKLKVDYIFITGDVSTTGLEKEFQKAKHFLSELSVGSKKLLLLPGNHDHYTKRDFHRKLFYRFFENDTPPKSGVSHENLSLGKDQIELRPLFGSWWYLAIDTVIATSLISSQGLFSEQLEEKLQKILQDFPKDQKILFLNHFPFFQFDQPRRVLLRGLSLGSLLQKTPQVRLYLHGHTHRHCIADLRCANFPIILDSGSSTMLSRPSFNLLDLEEDSCAVTVFRFQENTWQPKEERKFSFS